MDEGIVYLAKAQESLLGAESELENGRYNNCANRCYYACFQAAIYALIQIGIKPSSHSGQWSHEFVWSRFVGELINRRKLYPSELRDTFEKVHILRETADYRSDKISKIQAERVYKRTNLMLKVINKKD